MWRRCRSGARAGNPDRLYIKGCENTRNMTPRKIKFHSARKPLLQKKLAAKHAPVKIVHNVLSEKELEKMRA